MNVFVQAVGWGGAVAILAAYFLNSAGLVPNGWIYQGLNLFGSLGVVAVSLHTGATPPAALNACWAIIAIVAIVRLSKSSPESKRN